MTSTSSPDSSAADSSALIQKVPVTLDTKGRVRTSKEQRRIILGEFERSGVSAARFAKLTGVKYSTLAGWLQRHRRSKPPGPARQVRLLEAVAAATSGAVVKAGGSLLTLHLSGGARLEISDARQIEMAAALLRALQKPC